jgi:hypothetical protein
MVPLVLGEGADAVGKGQRIGEAREVEGPLEASDAVALQPLPARDLGRALCDLPLSVTRGESRRQATHRSADSMLIAHLPRASQPAPGLAHGPEPRPRTRCSHLTPRREGSGDVRA